MICRNRQQAGLVICWSRHHDDASLLVLTFQAAMQRMTLRLDAIFGKRGSADRSLAIPTPTRRSYEGALHA